MRCEEIVGNIITAISYADLYGIQYGDAFGYIEKILSGPGTFADEIADFLIDISEDLSKVGEDRIAEMAYDTAYAVREV